MPIAEVSFRGRTIPLCGLEAIDAGNVFTVFIGSNGSGKSSILRWVCSSTIRSQEAASGQYLSIDELLPYEERRNTTKFDEPGEIKFLKNKKINIFRISEAFLPAPHGLSAEHFEEYLASQPSWRFRQDITFWPKGLNSTDNCVPSRVIAVSSSPFDKFPTIENRRRDLHLNEYYKYHGTRTSNRTNKNYLKSKFDQLGASFVSIFLRTTENSQELLPLFEYLGFEPNFKIKLQSPESLGRSLFEHEEGGVQRKIESVRFFKGYSRKTTINEEDSQALQVAINALRPVNYIQGEHGFHNTTQFEFELNLGEKPQDLQRLEHIAILVKYDLVELTDIAFKKANPSTSFLLTEASSGELCILFNCLAIAGAIENDSIILIDEPELSLHPKWQTEFILLLDRLFKHKTGCHFILATHSPQIISSLPAARSFVINLDSTSNATRMINGDQVALKSADQLLATAFQSPGRHNEYVISQTIELLGRLCNGQLPTAEWNAACQKLLDLRHFIPADDPAQKLLSTLAKAIEALGNE